MVVGQFAKLCVPKGIGGSSPLPSEALSYQLKVVIVFMSANSTGLEGMWPG